jgi:hypothetical protein
MTSFNPENMTYSGLQRFVEATDRVMQADDLHPCERNKLIDYWAYQFNRADMLEQLDAAILRCQSSESVHPTASSILDAITGEAVAFSEIVYR